MLLVRRSAPARSYFEDQDRAADVFGVLATRFAVLLRFVVFLASRASTRRGPARRPRPRSCAEQLETAQLMPPAVRDELCRASSCVRGALVHQEWPRMERGARSDGLNPMDIRDVSDTPDERAGSASEQAAYSKWLDQRSDRQEARATESSGAEGGPLPTVDRALPLRVVIFGFMLLFADSSERAFVQATMMAASPSSSLRRSSFSRSSTVPSTTKSGAGPTAMRRLSRS